MAVFRFLQTSRKSVFKGKKKYFKLINSEITVCFTAQSHVGFIKPERQR